MASECSAPFPLALSFSGQGGPPGPGLIPAHLTLDPVLSHPQDLFH